MSRISLDRLVGAQKVALQLYRTTLGELKNAIEEAGSLSAEVADAHNKGLDRMWQDVITAHQELVSRNLPDQHAYIQECIFGKIQKARNEIIRLVAPVIVSNTRPQNPNCRELVSPTHSLESPAKLPKIQLPQFSGIISDWPEFSDLFENVVHKNSRLNDAVKLQYLKSSVTGEAAELIKHYKVTRENYASAWQDLEEHYANIRYLIQEDLDRLFKLKLGSGNLEQDLRMYINKANGILRYFPTRAGKGDRRRSLPLNSIPGTRRVHHTIGNLKCLLCAGDHRLAQCECYLKKRVDERRSLVAKLNLCFNCLSVNHKGNSCRSQPAYGVCKERHHSTLHFTTAQRNKFGKPKDLGRRKENKNESHHSSAFRPLTNDFRGISLSGAKKDQPPANSEAASASVARVNFAVSLHCHTVPILATAIINIETADGMKTRARAFLDQGSEVSFISESLVQVLHIKPRLASLPLVGLGSHPVGFSQGIVNFTIGSTIEPEFRLETEAYVLPQLVSRLPSHRAEKCNTELFSSLCLADPEFSIPGKIDMIIGADLYAQLLHPGVKKLNNNRLVAQNTALGWIISGVATTTRSRRADSSDQIQVHHCQVDDELIQAIEKFWRLEEPAPPDSMLKPDEELCEEIYSNSVSRDPSGRYSVSLPVRGELPHVAVETKRIAMGSMAYLRKRFSRGPELAAAYIKFMREYEELGHMELVPASESANPRAWYLPHHPVVSVNRDGFKLRVVFDASRKTRDGDCLNKYLLPGAALQTDLALVLLNWRQYRFAFTADIVKMFRQIEVRARDRELQRIVWSANPKQQLKEYRLKTVTYGTACAPFLAIRTLRQVASDEGNRFPRGANCLLKNTYVDDIFTGADTVQEAREIRNELIDILGTAGISLDKWAASCDGLCPKAKASSDAIKIKDISIDDQIKTLGVCWRNDLDSFTFRSRVEGYETTWTKRRVLSHIARLFDPLDWIAPVIISARILMQDLVVVGTGWDDPLPHELQERWSAYRHSLYALPEIQIDPWLGTFGEQGFQIHGFSDASLRAYAAAVYLKICNGSCSRVVLISAKTKVAPTKRTSLPNVELCGAVLLVQLISRIQQLDWLKNLPIFLWTDSEIVLAWLDKHQSQWKTFVANRVSLIQVTFPAANWSYVPTAENPANVATRDCTPLELSQHHLWWHGPQWLAEAPEQWPTRRRKARVAHTRIEFDDSEELFAFSTYTRMIRGLVYCRRIFLVKINKLAGLDPLPDFLTTAELAYSEFLAISWTQRSAYASEIMQLELGVPLPKDNSLMKLRPFLDAEGLLRVGGRLSNAEIEYERKHPVILPREANLSRLLVLHAHCICLHGGSTLTTATLLRFAWIPGCRRLVKTTIRNCISCQRAKPRLAHQLMGDLPAERITVARPFARSGLDYAGPVQVRTTKGRGYKSYKGYIALFVCLATKTVHIEIVSDLTTTTFLAAFRRFISRRGHCEVLISDNATTFRGADAELRSLFRAASKYYQEIGASLANQGTTWKFIPPNTLHYGGLWEAGVRSIKYHLRRTIGERTLTFEEYATLLAEVEACLNSRPLYPLSNDPEDLNALTPAHFLHGGPAAVLPSKDSCEGDTCIARFQQLQRLRNQLWKRWTDEYLQHLQERTKWRKPQENFKMGQLVILRDDRFPPTKWPLGRIVATHPGPDGYVRVVTVKTATSVLKRHISRIAPLLLPEEPPSASK